MSCRRAVALCICQYFLAAALLPLAAEADEFRLLPSVSEELRYNDNVFFDSRHQIHDYISYTMGGLELVDNTERLNLDLSAKGAQSLYKDNTDLNAADLLTNGTARYSLTTKLALSGRVNYTATPSRTGTF